MALPLIVNTTIVKQAIGIASDSVNVLCNNYNINRWSKYKPVRYDSVAPNRGAGADWWRAHDGNCGLSIPSYPNMSAMFTALRGGANTWDYLPPTGVAGQPLRLADFRGYEHSAQSPFVPRQLNNTYYRTLGIIGTALDLSVQGSNELTISDLGDTYNLGAMYFGVAICQQGTSGYKYMTENITMSAGGGGGINVPISSELGTYEVVYFLAEKSKLSFSDPDKTNTFIPIPNAMQIVYIENSPISVYVLGTFAMMTANYEITIQNNQANTLTLTGCNIAFRYGNNLPDDDIELGEKKEPLGTITVQGNSSLTVSGVITGVGADWDTKDGGYLWFSNITNAAYNKRGEFEA